MPTPFERAALWLNKVPPAISGQNGHSTTYTAAVGLVHGFGLSETDALSLLSDWNRSCKPPWSDRDLIHKVRDAASKPHDKPAGHLLHASGSPQHTDLSRVVFKPAKPLETDSEFKRFLTAAFAQGETVSICEQVEDGKPNTSGSFLPVEEWIKRFDTPDSILLHASGSTDLTRVVFKRPTHLHPCTSPHPAYLLDIQRQRPTTRLI